MKKLVSVLLAAMFAATLAVGCGGGSTPASEAATTAAATTAAPAGSETPQESEAAAAGSEAVKESKELASGGDAKYVDGLGEITAKEKYQIGFTMPTRDQFLSAMETAAKEAAADLKIELTTVDANNNSNTQIQNVQTFASQGCKAIIVGLVNTDNAQQVLDAANGIPVVFVNRRPTLQLPEGKAAYVGSDEKNAGKFEGEFLAKYFKDKGKKEVKTVMLQGVLGLESVINRTDSAYKALEDAGLKVDKVYEDTAEWDRAKAQNKMQTFLGTNKDFDCVICNNDEMALGAIEAMKASGIDVKEKPVVGIDATPAGLESMEKGDLAFTVFQNPVGQGAGAVRAAVMFANGDKVPVNIDIPFEPVDHNNFKEYMQK